MAGGTQHRDGEKSGVQNTKFKTILIATVWCRSGLQVLCSNTRDVSWSWPCWERRITSEMWGFNPLTPELNPSAQRCLTRFTVDFASWIVHFVNICVKTYKYTNYSFSLLCMVTPTCFGITLPSSGSVPSAFWEMLNPSTIFYRLVLGTLPADCNVMPKHVGSTIHNQ
jgi:hypothetical protein